MGMVVQHNMNALNAYNRLNANVTGLRKASEKLSSGYRINRAGDDAAGLAVSEKMRSQIRGLNQAIRNSQDGINMIQTFEGAAQETHSILQRMKELATESANGTYDNATDRAAMELEFKQLNDELDQIADTDFNGTIVLNGGQMSDGMYALKDGALLTSDNGGEYLNGLEFDYATGKKLFGNTDGVDVTTRATDPAHDILANNVYDKTMADEVWKALGLTTKDATQVNITFKKNGNTWEAVAATKGTPGVAATEATTTTTPEKAATAKNGSFDDAGGAGGTMTFDDTKVLAWMDGKTAADGQITVTIDTGFATATVTDKDGKTVGTITGGNKASLTTALTNAGMTLTDMTAGDAITFDYTAKVAATTTTTPGTAAVAGGEVDITADVADKLKSIKGAQAGDGSDTDAAAANGDGGLTLTIGNATMEAVFNANDAADGDYVTFTFTNSNEVSLAPTKVEYREDSFVDDATNDGIVKASDLTVEVDLATDVKNSSKMTKEMEAALDALNKASFTVKDDDTLDMTDDSTLLTFNATTGKITFKDAAKNDVELATIDPAKTKISDDAKQKLLDAGATAGASEFGFKVKTAQYKFAEADVEAHNIATTDALKSAMEGEKPLSISDAFSNSTARLTYSNNIVLQTGARSKDAVRFTFKYNQDDSVDMRGLQANLNLSSRADGLATKNLSLATQESANYAIDQIDKAINKTSMVRATFGAIQNRLEHKITNLTTTSENLTEAESSIRDTDMASEMMNYTKFNILQQAAQSMLAQANQQPQSILQLLG